MMWKRATAVLLCGAMTLSLLTGCGGGENVASSASGSAQKAQTGEALNREDTLIYGAEFMDENFNPLLGSLYSGSMLYRGLMTTDENCKLQCDIATDYKVSDNLLEYTFTTRDDVTFHDGSQSDGGGRDLYHRDHHGRTDQLLSAGGLQPGGPGGEGGRRHPENHPEGAIPGPAG